LNKNYNLTNETSYSGIQLMTTLTNLLDTIGQPSNIGSGDNKIQLEWVFVDKEKTITIYDWKENTPIHKIECWHIGSKNITTDEIISFLIFIGFIGDQIVKN
ncbi:MAG: hypothetical protein Q7R95_01765, partial [bacterium]|nr:hypothetical protein [bacterium]